MRTIEIIYIFIIGVGMSIFLNIAKESRNDEKIKQIKIGNFALPGSQQPSPLIGFGQNILNKGDLQLLMLTNQLKGSNKNFKEVIFSLLYGIRDNFSILVEIPIAAEFKIDNFSSHGLQDLLMQLEYAIYTYGTATMSNEITLVANMKFPTGSVCKEPSTGFGAPSFFLGFTASHVVTEWYYFVSSGILLPTKHNNTRFGNQFLYQWGIGRNMCYKQDKWIFNVLLELDGSYKQRDKLRGRVNCNSGGNDILFGPSLWFSTQHLILQFGISGIISQHVFGVQPKDRYFLLANIGWNF